MVEISQTAAALIDEAARLEGSGRLDEARATYQHLLERWPDLPDSWYNLGLLQRRLGLFDAALDSYAQALRRGVTKPEQVHLNRAVIFSDCLRQDAVAERELRAALACNAGYIPALQNLANLHEDLGQRQLARNAYERILELEPYAFEALARWARLAEPTGARDPSIGRLRAALAHPAADAAACASLGFALAQLLDQTGEYPQAFAAAQAANRASRAAAGAGVHYDREGLEELVGALIQAFPGPPAAQLPQPAGATDGRVRPIFICGMFRSGSTLTEQLLSGHPEVTPGGELDILPRLIHSALTPFPAAMAAARDETLAALAERYLDEAGRRYPAARRVTDKRLENFLYVGLIKRLFPRARIVHTTRDALDTCLSIFFLHLDQRVSWALDLMDIGHYFRQYRRLMAHWHGAYAQDILEFNYDRLVTAPGPTARQLFAFCGLEWNEAYLDFAHRRGSIKTASVWQVRKKLYRHSSGRARHYARELASLAEYLAAP